MRLIRQTEVPTLPNGSPAHWQDHHARNQTGTCNVRAWPQTPTPGCPVQQTQAQSRVRSAPWGPGPAHTRRTPPAAFSSAFQRRQQPEVLHRHRGHRQTAFACSTHGPGSHCPFRGRFQRLVHGDPVTTRAPSLALRVPLSFSCGEADKGQVVAGCLPGHRRGLRIHPRRRTGERERRARDRLRGPGGRDSDRAASGQGRAS